MKSIFKILRRNIKKSLSQFLSLAAISAIGVAMYVGVSSVPSTMQENAQTYFDKQLLSDIELVKPMGFTDKEITKIQDKLPNAKIEKSIIIDALLKVDDQEHIVRFHTNEKINQVHIVDGRAIQNDNECLVDITNDFFLNRTLTFEANGLKQKCKIVGTFITPTYLSLKNKGYSELGVGAVGGIFYTSNNFAKEFMDQIPFIETYNSLSIILDGKPDNRTFHEKYQTFIEEKVKLIEDLFDEDEVTITPRHDSVLIDSFYDDSSKIREIAAVFPVIFFLVAALVGSSTMSRMVEDERMQIGTLSSIGYSRFSIINLYLMYSLSAVALGIIVGTVAGFTLIPTTVTSAYTSLYDLPDVQPYFNQYIALQAIVISILMIVGATLMVVYFRTKESCAMLLRPKSPIAGKKILLEKISFIWNHLSFLNKVSMRNLFRYKKRFLMTVLAIMGCSGLLITGLGIKTSVTPIGPDQFNKIFHYEIVAYTEQINASNISEEVKRIKEIDNVTGVLASNRKNAKVTENDKYSLTLLMPNDNKKINDFITFDNSFNDDSIIVTHKLARLFNLEKGSDFTITIDDKEYTFTITDITTNYIGNYLYINKDAFKNAFDNINYNSFLIQNDGKAATVIEDLKEISYFKTIEDDQLLKDTVAESFKGMNELVYIIIAFAGLLVIVVMYCLTNINLIERRRELATLKVLGFFDREVSSYILKENILLTLIGLIFGTFFGKYIHLYIFTMIEVPEITFITEQQTSSYLLAYVITMVFALSVNLLMQKKIKNIDMVDSLKSVE